MPRVSKAAEFRRAAETTTAGRIRASALARRVTVKSAARVMDHPIHPMLIPFPFAFLSGAAAFDLAALARGSHTLGQTAAHLRAAGLVSALVAAVPGLIDYLTTVP